MKCSTSCPIHTIQIFQTAISLQLNEMILPPQLSQRTAQSGGTRALSQGTVLSLSSILIEDLGLEVTLRAISCILLSGYFSSQWQEVVKTDP